MYVPVIHELAWKIPKKADGMENLKNRKNSKNSCATIVERHLIDEIYQKRTHEQRYTQTGMEYFDTTALARKNYVATPEERRYHRDQNTVVQPNQ